MSELGWDYSAIRRILTSFNEQRLLPGYVATSKLGAVGYTYFMTHRARAIIGTVYVSKEDHAQEAADEILSLAIGCLKTTSTVRRIEAQIIALNDVNLSATFTRHGFGCHPRCYLELDLRSYVAPQAKPSAGNVIPWDHSFLPRTAAVTLDSYRGQPDAQICEDYRTLRGCEGYLRSLIENPGCGCFLPEASFVGLEADGNPSGFLMASKIAEHSGMIPQVAILPSQQGQGLGGTLMSLCLARLQALGFHTVSLTVTRKNRRAFEWYLRLGFRIRKEFGAFVWER